ncbi:MAG: TetR/AcrR family transcriptional regulator [candidate division Zixibacteria bacterium]|jgi:AcrR family transcriptional regulator|nr:TetR/AcrR family transcriptional regulator [candidate division Zixibacteria bacterium]
MTQRTTKAVNTRRRILNAAFREITTKGYIGANINKIVAASGVTKGALYYYFKSKHELAMAVIDEVIGSKVLGEWLKPLSEFANPIDGLRRIVNDTLANRDVDDVDSSALMMRLTLGTASIDRAFRQQLKHMHETVLRVTSEKLSIGKRRNLVRSSVDPTAVATQFVAFLTGTIYLATAFQDSAHLRDGQLSLHNWLDTMRTRRSRS